MRPANDAATLAILCLVACVRVFVYSAAFPFFNNVDEQAHLDLVCKYSHGHVPRQLEGFGRESAELITLYQSPVNLPFRLHMPLSVRHKETQEYAGDSDPPRRTLVRTNNS